MSENEKKYCNHCICKTCAIAYVNGGAEGCGDCDFCKSHEYHWFNNECKDYYNPKKIGDTE